MDEVGKSFYRSKGMDELAARTEDVIATSDKIRSAKLRMTEQATCK